MNAYLKELATLCGIEKKLTFHAARHTFATTVTLSNGIPLETHPFQLAASLVTTHHFVVHHIPRCQITLVNVVRSLKMVLPAVASSAMVQSSF